MAMNDSPRGKQIRQEATASGWAHEHRARLSLGPYRAFAALGGLGRSLPVENRVDGTVAELAFTYFEYEGADGPATACVFFAPFNSPGLRIGTTGGNLHIQCQEPGFVAAVVEEPVRAMLAENGSVRVEWHGDRLLVQQLRQGADWSDFRTVAEVLARLMTRVPEMEFETIEVVAQVATAAAPLTVGS